MDVRVAAGVRMLQLERFVMIDIDVVSPISEITAAEKSDLIRAKGLAENPGLAGKITAALGVPMERGFAMLPKDWPAKVESATNAALEKALKFAVASLGRSGDGSSEMLHKVLAGASGALGGTFGFATMALELPVSTTIMLRSIAQIARDEGADLTRPEMKLACLEVLGLGTPPLSKKTPLAPAVPAAEGAAPEAAPAPEAPANPAPRSDSIYWAFREEIGSPMVEAATLLATRTICKTSSPAMARFFTVLSRRFSVVVSQIVAAKAVPLLGAAGGAATNVLFMSHFQEMARAHFIIKRLEGRYGIDAVRELYLSSPASAT
jgi:hypothetical protein